MRTVAFSLFTLLWIGALGQAQEPDATERARRLFDEGRQLHQRRDYEGARQRFEAARAIKPMPELDYNVGFCWDKLGRGDEALREYHKYLDALPNAPNAEIVRARIAVLEQARATAAAAALAASRGSSSPSSASSPSSGARTRGRLIAPIAVGAGALAMAIVGSALVGSVKPEFDRLAGECAGMCAPSRWSGLEARANAGYALWGIAGALAVADVVLWVVALRSGREQLRALVTPAGAGRLAITF